MAAVIPDDVLTNPARWAVASYGFDPAQPTPTAVASGMQLDWNLHDPPYSLAMRGVWVELRAGVPYTFTVDVASSTVAWKASVPYFASSALMPSGPGRARWTYTPTFSYATILGVEIASPVTTGTTVVSRVAVSVPRTPQVRVLADFANPADSGGRTWTDITAYIATEEGPITCSRGRADEWAQVEPGRTSFPLDNSDGRFTFGYASGAYYPGVRPGRRVRVYVSGIDDDAESARGDGYVDGWPSRYVGGDASRSIVTITASDRMSALGDMRKLRDPLLEELGDATYASGQGWTLDSADLSILDSTTILAGGVDWLYGLQESSGSTVAGDVSGALGRPNLTVQQVGADGTLEFGAAGIMPEGTAAQFSPESAGNGVVLTSGAQRPVAYVGTEFALFCQFAWTGSTGASLVQLGTAPGSRVTISVTPTTVVATLVAASGGSATVTKTTSTGNNRPHFACVSVSGTTVSLYVDHLAAATGTLPADTGTAQGLTIGGTTSADVHQVAWVGFSNGALPAEQVSNLAGLATAAAERSDVRIARILGYLGIAEADMHLEEGLSDVAYQAMGGQSALDLIKTVNEVEAGVFFADAAGRFVQHSRSHRYGATAVVTPDPDEVSADFEVQVDRSSIVNDLILSRPAGATVHVVDQESVDEFNVRNQGDGATLYAASDTDLQAAAEWRLSRLSQPLPRSPQVTIDLMTCSDATRRQALAASIGDRLTITGLPDATTPGGGTVDVFIEGISDSIAPTAWSVTFATSPVWGADIWTLDESALDSETVLTY